MEECRHVRVDHLVGTPTQSVVREMVRHVTVPSVPDPHGSSVSPSRLRAPDTAVTVKLREPRGEAAGGRTRRGATGIGAGRALAGNGGAGRAAPLRPDGTRR